MRCLALAASNGMRRSLNPSRPCATLHPEPSSERKEKKKCHIVPYGPCPTHQFAMQTWLHRRPAEPSTVIHMASWLPRKTLRPGPMTIDFFFRKIFVVGQIRSRHMVATHGLSGGSWQQVREVIPIPNSRGPVIITEDEMPAPKQNIGFD